MTRPGGFEERRERIVVDAGEMHARSEALFDPDSPHYADFGMTALSRVTNTWTLRVTGTLRFLLAGWVVVSRFRRVWDSRNRGGRR
ncbi:MAG: hypothetical protein R6W82_02930 [bacterium]